MADLYWQCSKDVHEANLHMLNNEILCDIAFLVGNNGTDSFNAKHFPLIVYKKLVKEGIKSPKSRNATPKKFNCHRYILVTRSAVFERMLVSDMTEGKKSLDDPITVVDIDPDTFQEMLLYIYGNAARISNDNVFRLWYAARKYMLEGLEALCMEHLLNNLTQSNVCAALEHCLFFDSSQSYLKQHIMNFISFQFCCVSELEYIQLSHRAFSEILSLDSFREINDLELYLMLRRWVEFRVKKLGYTVTVACNTCGLEYEVQSTELNKLCGSTNVSSLIRLAQIRVANERNKKCDQSSNKTVNKSENKLSSCTTNSVAATALDNFNGIDNSSISNITEFPERRTWPYQPCGKDFIVLDDAENFILQVSGEIVSLRLQTLGSYIFDSEEEEEEDSPSCSMTQLKSNNTRNSAAQTSSVTGGRFTCNHISDENPQDGLHILLEKMDISKKTAIRQILGDMIYRIRFSMIPEEQFALVLGNSYILTAEEKNAIYYDRALRKRGLHYTPRDGSATFDRVPRILLSEETMTRLGDMDIDNSDDEHGGRYVGTSSLSFKVTRPILLLLVIFHTGAHDDCEPFRVELKIKLNDVILSTLDSSFVHDPVTGNNTDEISPYCYIRENIWYEVEFTIHPSRGPRYYGVDGTEKVKEYRDDAAPEFHFKHNYGTTTIEQGQLPMFVYSYV